MNFKQTITRIKRKIYNEWYDKSQVCVKCGQLLDCYQGPNTEVPVFYRCHRNPVERKTYTKTPKCMVLYLSKCIYEGWRK